MDKYADKMRDIMQVRQYPLKLETVFHGDLVCSKRNSGFGIDFTDACAGKTFGGVGTNRRKFSYDVLDGIAKELTVNK